MMKQTLPMSEAVKKCSLIFKRPGLENAYLAQKEAEFRQGWPRWILLLTSTFVSIACTVTIYNDSQRPNSERFYAGIATVIVLNAAVGLELLVHLFRCLRYVRGFCVVVGLFLAGSIYGTYVHASPAFQPGSIVAFTISFFNSIYFSHNWVTSSVNIVCGHFIATIFLAIRYLDLLRESMANIVPLLNFNSSLIFLPLLFYFLERDKRQISFLNWINRKETHFWQKLVGALPLALIIAKENAIVYLNPMARTLLKFDGQPDSPNLIVQLRLVLKHTDRGQTLYDALFDEAHFQDLNGAQYVCPATDCDGRGQGKTRRDSPMNDRELTPSDSPQSNPDEVATAVTLIKFRKGDEEYKVCILQDQRVLEELNQVRVKIQYQKDFFAMITHELRNPLHGIMGIIETVSPALPSKELQDHCMVALRTSKLMMSLVNDILDVSQLEANKLTLADNWHDFVEAAEECVEILRQQYERKRLSLSLIVPSSIPLVYNDRHRYCQIVINLLSNAVKFTQQGGVTLRLAYDTQANRLTTAVIDTGVGISRSKQQGLFQLYGKVSSNSRNPQGIGLGLFVCKKLSEQMGGSISVESEEGKGSTFLFTIKNKCMTGNESKVIVRPNCEIPAGTASQPFSAALNDSAQTLVMDLSSMRAPLTSSPRSDGRVLIIDDEFSSAHVLKMFCSSVGLQAESAASGDEGLEMIKTRLADRKANPYDLLFVDMHMPGLNGLQTAERIRELYAARRSSYIIFGLSGDSGEDLRRDCLEAGMKELLSKPFAKQDFLRVLAKYDKLPS